ncbi:expressed unknown protein [Ectocarpus siliculosus]|uniref:Uncharacterized protein n=1 Tax=Ectocarpus siliculosus TaxID=2880 RepID=D7FKA4_ECTSI|nr:expressed unknown protein [Ectocarpus siliculosus]|eukprot:CBJ29309.1 expressed unknown protein [Ectocarpus siliculosus]
MSWAEGREAAMPAGATGSRQEALDRVDGMLRALARDKLLQDDLRNTDVKRALEHWTGQNRMSQDHADELMEDNYRIQSVCSRMAELQSLCKQASIGLPLSHVLAGKGLYDNLDQPGQASAAATSGSGGNAVDQTGRPTSTSDGSSSGLQRRKGATAKGLHDATAGAEVGTGKEEDEPSWRRALAEEALRLTFVCLCALVFTLLLKHYRGDDPLGKGLPGQQQTPPSAGEGEL